MVLLTLVVRNWTLLLAGRLSVATLGVPSTLAGLYYRQASPAPAITNAVEQLAGVDSKGIVVLTVIQFFIERAFREGFVPLAAAQHFVRLNGLELHMMSD